MFITLLTLQKSIKHLIKAEPGFSNNPSLID